MHIFSFQENHYLGAIQRNVAHGYSMSFDWPPWEVIKAAISASNSQHQHDNHKALPKKYIYIRSPGVHSRGVIKCTYSSQDQESNQIDIGAN